MIRAIFIGLLVVMLPVCFADSLSYDANGNLVTGDGKYREYNSLNQLISVYNGSDSSGFLLEEFTYHPTEERVLVKKDYVNNETTYYFSKSFVRVVNSSGSFNQTFVYHDGQLVAQDIDGERLYVYTDHLGSATVVTDENGTVVENTTYSPYGEILTGGSSKLDYEGKEFDSVLGSYDFHFRQYNPEWGIFSQPDTLIQNVYDPQSLNRYMFERGNPYGNVDEDGHVYCFPYGCAPEIYIVLLFFTAGSVAFGIYYNRNSNQELYEYDYFYEYAGPPDAYQRLAQLASEDFAEIDKLNNRGDALLDFMRLNQDGSQKDYIPSTPFDVTLYPPGIYLNPVFIVSQYDADLTKRSIGKKSYYGGNYVTVGDQTYDLSDEEGVCDSNPPPPLFGENLE